MSTCKTTIFRFVPLCLVALTQLVGSTSIYRNPHRSHHTAPSVPNDFPESIKQQVRDSWTLDDAIEWPTTTPQTAAPSSECIKDTMECPYISEINQLNLPRPSTNMLSTSPWKYVQNVDPNRYPRRINEACCVCMYCVSYNAGIPQESGDNYVSVAIKAHIQVAIRNGTDYVLVRKEIARGCTCSQVHVDLYGGQTV